MTPCTPRHRHLRLLILLASILLSSVALFFICFAVGQRAGWITFALVAPECLLLMLRTTHVVARYLLYLQSLHRPTYNQLSHGNLTLSIQLGRYFWQFFCFRLEPSVVLHRIGRGNLLLDPRFRSPRSHALKGQHVAVYGFVSHFHAATSPVRATASKTPTA